LFSIAAAWGPPSRPSTRLSIERFARISVRMAKAVVRPGTAPRAMRSRSARQSITSTTRRLDGSTSTTSSPV
jgi:hypothetical protein